MAVIKIRWRVSELDNVMTLFDTQKVYRSTTGIGGAYVEITDAVTRVDLVAGQESYYFDDTTGDPTYWYKISYYNSTTLAESPPSDPIQGSESVGYISLDDVRDAGVTVTQADDATVLHAINLWTQFIDRVCGQWFEPRTLDLSLDGTGCQTLWLQVPIITITGVYINRSTVVLDPEYYEIYNNLGDGLRDDRRDPKICLKDDSSVDFFSRAVLGLSGWEFEVGRKNQRLTGTFGFVEPDLSTPKLIQRAVLKLVVKRLSSDDPLSSVAGPAGPIVSESTDGHRIQYGGVNWGKKFGLMGITGDPEVDQIITLYKAPKIVRVIGAHA